MNFCGISVQSARLATAADGRQECGRTFNPNAAHPVNAILNHAYATLESEIRIKAISDGYDPIIGIMHAGSDGSSKFIFVLMEPERPKVDRAVLRDMSSIRPILSFAQTAYAGSIRKWRGWWWGDFQHNTTPICLSDLGYPH